MQNSKLIAALLAASILTACTEPNGEPGRGIENGGALSKRDVGIAAGVVSGVAVGSLIGGGAGQVVAMVGGGLLGGMLGNSIGASMDNADRAAYDRASQQAMESGQTRTWNNSDSGHSGSITPRKRYKNAEGQYCRQYTQRIVIDGKNKQGRGTACRADDGTWNIVD